MTVDIEKRVEELKAIGEKFYQSTDELYTDWAALASFTLMREIECRMEELNQLSCHCGEHLGMDADIASRLRELSAQLEELKNVR